jgi:hypothetical protein
LAKIGTRFCIFWQNYGKVQQGDRQSKPFNTQPTHIFGKNKQKIFAVSTHPQPRQKFYTNMKKYFPTQTPRHSA